MLYLIWAEHVRLEMNDAASGHQSHDGIYPIQCGSYCSMLSIHTGTNNNISSPTAYMNVNVQIVSK